MELWHRAEVIAWEHQDDVLRSTRGERLRTPCQNSESVRLSLLRPFWRVRPMRPEVAAEGMAGGGTVAVVAISAAGTLAVADISAAERTLAERISAAPVISVVAEPVLAAHILAA